MDSRRMIYGCWVRCFAVISFPKHRNVLEPGCQRCPALVDSREQIVWGTGPTDARVMVIGEAPGAGDPAADRWKGGNWTGMAYTTRHSGRRIRQLLTDIGRLDECYFTNAVKCFPADGCGSNRPPAPDELNACLTHLVTELKTVRPDVILPTGKYATETVLTHHGHAIDGFIEHVLTEFPFPDAGYTVVPLLHPSYETVWIARLGYTQTEYVRAVGECVDNAIEVNRFKN